MSKPFHELNILVQQFVQEMLRPTMLMVADRGPDALQDLRQMLIASAKGTIDLEMDIKEKGQKPNLVIVGQVPPV